MSGWFNPCTMSPGLASQLRQNLALHASQHMAQAQACLQQIQSLDQMQYGGAQAFQPFGHCGLPPQCGCLPQPQMQFSGAPAGKGLQTDPQGWPKGSVTTAGGYTVVPEGSSAAWKIYAPGQKPTDTPNTRVWGDPHVNEKDGTRWDFTKNGAFKLPDGTTINVDTTSQTGQSVTKSLEIINGSDRVTISGINNNKPVTSGVSHDGYERLAATTGTRDVYRLGGDQNNVKWFKESADGSQQGLITGAYYDCKTQGYQQRTDKSQSYCVDPRMRPEFGSAAWGNQLRMQAAEQIGHLPISGKEKELLASNIGWDHFMGELSSFGGAVPFGGCPQYFGGWNQMAGSVGNLGDLMLMAQLAQFSRSGYMGSALYC